MSKIMALDLGDQWVGIALSDASNLIVKPLTTVKNSELISFLRRIISEERIETIVVGYPKTMSGRESEQTKKVVAHKELLEKELAPVSFILWDERLSSQRAQALGQQKSKEEKLRMHARAAAFILDSYITYILAKKGEGEAIY